VCLCPGAKNLAPSGRMPKYPAANRVVVFASVSVSAAATHYRSHLCVIEEPPPELSRFGFTVSRGRPLLGSPIYLAEQCRSGRRRLVQTAVDELRASPQRTPAVCARGWGDI